MKHYRPVALLPVLAKVIDKVMVNEHTFKLMNNYIYINELVVERQKFQHMRVLQP